MRSFYEIARDSGTDKVTKHSYHLRYPIFFESMRDKPINIFEMGLAAGKSLNLWKEYFPKAKITGLDIKPRFKVKNTDDVFIYTGDQRNERLLVEITKSRGPFDIIIDDAGHRMAPQQIAFRSLLPSLVAGGWYVIEDIQTSYLAAFKGGYKRPTSTVELLKTCIDIMHARHINDQILVKSPEGKDDETDHYPYNLIDGVFIFEEIAFIRRKPEVVPQPFVVGPDVFLHDPGVPDPNDQESTDSDHQE